MGVEEGINFINTQSDIDAIFITKDKNVYVTNGLRNIFQLTNTDFILQN